MIFFFFFFGLFDFKIRAIAIGVLLNTRLPSQLIAKSKLGEHSRDLTDGDPQLCGNISAFFFLEVLVSKI